MASPREGGFASLPNNTASKWWQDAGLRKLNCFIGIVWLAQVVNGFDVSLIGSMLAMPQFYVDMGYPDSVTIGVLTGMVFAGAFFGTFPSAWICDKWGRKMGLLCGCVFSLIGVIISTAAWNYGSYIAGRFLIGFGISFTLCAGPPLTSELAHPRQRGFVSASYNVLWYVGAIFAAWISFGSSHMASTWSWRLPSTFQGIVPVIILICLYWIPESPRYLVSVGRLDEAKVVLAKYHANGDLDDALVGFEMEEITAALTIESEAAKHGWSVLWANKANIRRMVIVCSIPIFSNWCGQSVISYYFSFVLSSVGITTTAQQTGINGGLQIWNLLCSFSGILLAEKFGRRPMWMVSFAAMIVANIFMTLCSALYAQGISDNASYGIVIMLFIYDAAFNIACNPLLYCYPVEVLPYHMRSKGLAVLVSIASLCLTFNAFANSIALTAIGWRYYLVFLGVCVFALAFIYFFYPETKGLLLEEIAVKFEGDSAAVIIEGVSPTAYAREKLEPLEKGNGVKSTVDEDA